MARTKTQTPKRGTDDTAAILAPFLEFAEDGQGTLAQYLQHVGITGDDIEEAGHLQGAILRHYRKPAGGYDIDAAAHDLARWPPIANRIRELKRQF